MKYLRYKKQNSQSSIKLTTLIVFHAYLFIDELNVSQLYVQYQEITNKYFMTFIAYFIVRDIINRD